MGAMHPQSRQQEQPVLEPSRAPLQQVTEEQSEEEDGLDELMEFVRNKTPPPHNYMSIPDSFSTTSASSSEHRKWWRFKMFRRRKKPVPKKHRPPPIKLPDTAIAGTTVEGFRHIAISIPIEHAHLGPEPRRKRRSRRKDPSAPKPEKLIPAKAGSVKTLVSERGVVTVLKPVAEDRESMSSKSFDHMLSPSGMRPESPRSRHSMSKTAYEPIDSPIYPTIPDIPEELPEYSSRPRTADPGHSRHKSSNSMQSFSSAPNSPVTKRASAKTSNTRGSNPKDLVDDFIKRLSHHQRESSGDTVQQSDFVERPTSSRAVLGDAKSVAHDRRSSKRSSMNTITAREPRPSSSRNSVATIVPASRSKTSLQKDRAEQARGVSPLTKENLARASLERRISSLSEQEKSQDLKESAFEASLSMPEDVHRDISEAFKIVERLVESQTPTEVPRAKTRASSIVEELRPTSKCSNSTFTPIMVVADVQPEVPPSTVNLTTLRNKISQLQISAQPHALRPISPTTFAKSQPSSRLSSLISAAARIPTPPRSPQLPPEPPSPVDSAPQPIPLDRTSLARRREWAAEREREREDKERERQQERERSISRPQTARASMSLPPKKTSKSRKRYSLGATSEAAHNHPQEEPRGRYVHSRDKHVIEMERRLRRLERDGNAWLGAMMPLLNNLNQTLGKLQDEEDSELRRKEWGDGYMDIPELESFRTRPAYQYQEEPEEEDEFARPTRRPHTADANRHRRLSIQSEFESRGRSLRSRSRQSQASRQSWAGGPPAATTRMSMSGDRGRRISPYKMPLHEEPEEQQPSWQRRDERRRTLGQAPRDVSEFRRGAAAFRGRSRSQSRGSSSGESMVLGGGGLDNLEPLMRELMGGSRLGRESPEEDERRMPLDDDPETAFAMF